MVDTINQNIIVDGTTYARTSTGINAAVTALGANGGTILLTPGTYNITAKITGASNVIFQGSGNKTQLVLADSTNDTIFEFTSLSGVVVRDMYIDGNYGNQSSESYGIDIVGGSNILISNVYVFETYTHGCRIGDSASGVVVENCTFDGTYGDGCTIATSTNVMIRGCIATDQKQASSSGFGYYSTGGGSTRNAIMNCIAHSGLGNGFHFEGANHITCSNCVSHGNSKAGYAILEESGGQDSFNLVLSGCQAYNNTEYGITVNESGTLYIDIGDCDVWDNSLSGINVNTDAKCSVNIHDCMITGNNAKPNAGDRGIKIQGGTHGTIKGCHIFANTGDANTHGIELAAGADYWTITDNVIWGNKGHGIGLAGDHCIITYNQIDGNSAGQAGSKDGIGISNSTTNGILIGNRITDTQGTKTQEYGLDIGTSCTSWIYIANNLTGNRTGSVNGSFSSPATDPFNVT